MKPIAATHNLRIFNRMTSRHTSEDPEKVDPIQLAAQKMNQIFMLRPKT